MSYREYARHRQECGMTGTTLRAVQKAIEAGRISTIPDEKGRPFIDPAVADLQWASNTDAEQCLRGNTTQLAAGKVTNAANIGAAPQGTTMPSAAPGNTTAYWDAKTSREQSEARMAELNLQKMQGDLCDAAGTRRAAYDAGRMLRDMLLTIPTKIAPELADCTDRQTIERRLREELRKPLDYIARLGTNTKTSQTENGEDHGHE
jgi:hypothetical protein